MNPGEYVDQRIKIDTGEGFFEGTVKYIDKKQKKLVLKRVKDCTTGEYMKREQHFFGDQIKDLTILQEDGDTSRIQKKKSEEARDRTVKSKNQKKETKNEEEVEVNEEPTSRPKQIIMDESDDGTSLFQMSKMDPNLSGYDYSTSHSNGLHSPPKAVLVDAMGAAFKEAISAIKSQKVISFAAEGRKISRFGEISVIIIGTRQMVYLFDVTSLEEKCFTEGLTEVLEDRNLLKIVHDIRLISDCLNFVYHVKPKNVFDTQVADAFIYKQKSGVFPKSQQWIQWIYDIQNNLERRGRMQREVSTLTQCIQMYLNIHASECTFENDKRRIIQRNRNIWINRPIDEEFLKVCAKTGMYLRELRPVMLQRLLAEFLCGIDIYLDCVRDLSNNAAKLFNARMLPSEFDKISVYKQTSRRPGNRRQRHLTDNIYGSSSDEGSKDRSVWDTGRQFSEKYQEKHGEIIECMDEKNPLFDTSKPLLKTRNRETVEQNGRKGTPEAYINDASGSTKIEDFFSKQTSSNPKHYQQAFVDELTFESNEKEGDEEKTVFDRFQMSTSDSEDSSFFVSSVNDRPPKAKKVSLIETTDHRPKISPAGARMLKNYIRQYPSDPPQSSSSVVVPSTPPSLSEDEYPSIKTVSHIPSQEIPRGVKKTVTPTSGGRGKILKMLSEQQNQIVNKPIKKVTPSRSSFFSGKSEYEFPSDDELLEVPQVAKMVSPLVGQSVNVLKKFHTNKD